DGRRLDSRVDVPKGDPDNALTRDELEQKAIRLALFRRGATEGEMRELFARIWDIENQASLNRLFPNGG
ncbi:MAG TPA: hypothetical protein VEM39_07310, partial [Myxococcaceae bacterium]|nr:hypothetical protein [Myxococcaceae bacterium]